MEQEERVYVGCNVPNVPQTRLGVRFVQMAKRRMEAAWIKPCGAQANETSSFGGVGPCCTFFLSSACLLFLVVIPLSQQRQKRMDEEKKTLAKIVFYFALGALGFRNAQWFNSAEPMRSYYKFYVLVLILAQYFGMKSGQKLFEESQKIKSD